MCMYDEIPIKKFNLIFLLLERDKVLLRLSWHKAKNNQENFVKEQ